MHGSDQVTSYRCAGHEIVPGMRRLRRAGQDVELEAKVFDLIVLLVENRDRTLAKQDIVNALWGARPVTDAALSQLVYKARRIFDRDEDQPSVIRTVYGRGLQWAAHVEVLHEQVAPPTASTVAPPVALRIAPWRRPMLWALAILGVLAVVAIAWMFQRSATPHLSPAPRVAILPLDNATGNPGLDWTRHGLPGLVAGVLGDESGIDVVDPVQVARAWEFERPPGRSQSEHVRKVTGADVLVGTRLRQLAGGVYELNLHLDTGGPGQDADITITGSDAGALGIAAVARIRRALALQPVTGSPWPGALPADAYLAESYARGMDMATRGDWLAARPYFAVVAKGDASFLPGRLRLGQSQINTEQPQAADVTLLALLTQATQHKDESMQAQALLQLADLDLIRHEFSSALQRLQQALPLAHGAGDPDLEVAVALKAVNAASRMQRTDTAREMLARARSLIEDQQLHQREGDLHNSESFLAQATGDTAAAERADRAALAASEAVGNTHNALIDSYNLALVLLGRGHNVEALKLLARTFERAQATQFAGLAFASGDNLAIALLNAGLDTRAGEIALQLQALGVDQHNRAWQALALLLRGGQAWYVGDAHAALIHCDAAAALIDEGQDPDLMINTRVSQASAALLAAPERLPELLRQTDALIAAQSQPERFGYNQQLVHALAAAAGAKTNQVVTALHAAGAAPHGSDEGLENLRVVGLSIALVDHDVDVAAITLDGFNPLASENADLLRLAQAWSEYLGEKAQTERIADRRRQLRADASAALTGFDPPTGDISH